MDYFELGLKTVKVIRKVTDWFQGTLFEAVLSIRKLYEDLAFKKF